MTDEIIEEIYILAFDVSQGGLKKIPVYIFPFRMNDRMWGMMKSKHTRHGELISFWEELREGYLYFEEKKKVPIINIESNGKYILIN